MEYFGRRELAIAREKLNEAESLLSQYYCIPGREWPLYPYGVRTLVDVDEMADSEEVLASVSKYEVSIPLRVARSRFDYYEIRLQDHNILSASSRRGAGISFEPLMLYVLTHELVHVFRFANLPQRFFVGDEEKIQEERQVHQITSHILRMKNESGLAPVLEAYKEYPFQAPFSRQLL
jgi:hypothetical protein